MPIQFILGRSGSGKTHHCLEAIRGELRRDPTGPALILLVPEQATFQMEQALVAGDELGGFHRGHVMSFVRLARHILFDNTPMLPPLSETARGMILRRILQEHQDSLTIFSRTGARAGFVGQVTAAISEFRQQQITPAQLRAESEELSAQGAPASRPLVEKLADLATIYQAYMDHIADRFIDPDDLLDLLGRHCRGVDLLDGAKLWIDGFAGFTPQQHGILQALMAQVESTCITLCLDPEHRQFQLAQDRPDQAGQLDQVHLFHQVLRTYQQLLGRIKAASLAMAPPLILPGAGAAGPPRFDASGPLAQVERNFGNFAPAEDAPPISVKDGDLPDSDVVIVQATTRRREVDVVAGHILRLCREKDYRFRDIAVILRDIAPYRELIEASFSDHNIPYFLDQRRPVRHHPLVELLRSALALIGDDFKTDDVLNYLKTDLAPFARLGAEGESVGESDLLDDTETRAVVDAIENCARTQGFTSANWRGEKAWPASGTALLIGEMTPGTLEQYCRRALAPVISFRQNLYQGDYQRRRCFTVRRVTTELVDLLEALGVRRTLSRWCRLAESGRQLDAARIHQTLWSDIVALLDDLVGALGDSSVEIGEYGEILNASLAQLTLGLTPPALEQVLVGTIERSRHPRIRAAFVLGVNDGVFPRLARADAILTEDQRNYLARAGLQLAPTASERLLHERYLAYIAFTRPQEFLWVSYAIADEMGGALNRSSFIDDLQAAAPGAGTLCLGDGAAHPDPARITNSHQLNHELALALTPGWESGSFDATWQQLYRYGRSAPGSAVSVDDALAGVTYSNRAALADPIISRLFPANLTTSISRLESFSGCPFQHFARHVLALRPRDELKLGAVDLGNFYHDALRHIFGQLRGANLTWSQLGSEQVATFIEAAVDDLCGRTGQFARLLGQSERNAFLLNEARHYLHRFCLALVSAARAGNFQQTEAELSFGTGADLPGISIDLGDGGALHLRGIIDRVDTFIKDDVLGLLVFDYKSTARAFPFGHFYHGLALQLATYLLVLTEHYQSDGPHSRGPVGALYLPIINRPQSQAGPVPDHLLQKEGVAASDADERRKAIGIINGDWAGDLDHTLSGPGWSKYFTMYINKEGSAYSGNNKTVVTPEQMSALLKHCRGKLTELAEQLVAGRIDVAPYRLNRQSPCSFCEFRPLCRFDPRCDSYRILADFDRDAVLAQIG